MTNNNNNNKTKKRVQKRKKDLKNKLLAKFDKLIRFALKEKEIYQWKRNTSLRIRCRRKA